MRRGAFVGCRPQADIRVRVEAMYFFSLKNGYIAKNNDFPCPILFPQYRKIPKIRPVFSARKGRALNKVSKKENNSAFLFLLSFRLTPSTTANVRFLDEDVVLSGYHVPAQVSGRTVLLNCRPPDI